LPIAQTRKVRIRPRVLDRGLKNKDAKAYFSGSEYRFLVQYARTFGISLPELVREFLLLTKEWQEELGEESLLVLRKEDFINSILAENSE